jgi:single-stranded-DNA-specific exonuclease
VLISFLSPIFATMQKKWSYKTIPNETEVTELAALINVSTPIATLLLQRKITTFEQSKEYFRPTLEALHNPFLMKDMDKAVWRIEEAIRNKERILIYGDYDVDGTTSVALVYGFLRQFYSNLSYYTPDRNGEGYGVSEQGIKLAYDNQVNLIIALDCGIKSVEPVAYAKNLGIDFIICDHHIPADVLPTAYAILDPKRNDCTYPYKELSGCGIGFKLLQGLSVNNDIPLEKLYNFLDLVAVSIAADIVPINGENRILAYHGLKKLNNDPRNGLKAIIDTAGIKKPLDISSIVFGIAPRINASGRITHAKQAIELLLSDDYTKAIEFATQANTTNEQRRDFDSTTTSEALQMIENEGLVAATSTVLYKEDWHKGVIGIVASRCMDKYYRPTIILTSSNNKIVGSGRSIQGFDLYEALESCADVLEQYGGHTHAAGLSMAYENLAKFRERFEKIANEKLSPELLIPPLHIDTILPLRQVNFKFFNVLKQMQPYGPENMQPIFVSENVYCEGYVKVMKEEHIKIYVRQEDSRPVEAIGFGLARFQQDILAGKRFDIAYQIMENDFKGRVSLQLMLKDIKIKG